MPAHHAVIFDCDGTLVDSEPLAAEAFAEAVTGLGVACDAVEIRRRFLGRDMAGCLAEVETWLGGPLPDGFESSLRARMHQLFRERLEPMPGARALLESMAVPFAVASNGPRTKMELTLSITGLRPLFGDHVYSAYDVGRWKPDPAVFHAAARGMDVEPERCAVIEDSRTGIEAGLAAGMTVYAFAYEGPLPEGAIPLACLMDLAELLG